MFEEELEKGAEPSSCPHRAVNLHGKWDEAEGVQYESGCAVMLIIEYVVLIAEPT